jgi:[protein-PII] uridylyltransferase
MTAQEREARTAAADELCRGVFEKAVADRADDAGIALVAVGGYGRRELAPYSDLDVVLVHDPAVGAEVVTDVAEKVLYPLWDAGVRLDHAVRALDEVTGAAASDVRVALGLLDTRHLAGDTSVSLRLRADVLSRWRRDARVNLPRLRDLVGERVERVGELAHAAVPDLKESGGGLRDATVLKALVATWVVDVPHVDLERCRLQLLDLRDLLQDGAGRATDRVTPELWGALVAGLPPDLDLAEWSDRGSTEDAAQRWLRQIGRRTAHLARLTWSRVDQVLAPAPPPTRSRRPRLDRLAPGVALANGEVVLDKGADPARDPMLVLRAAAAAAERQVVLAPASAARLAAEATPLPEPWPVEARDLLVRLLASGAGLLPVWETLDQTGAVDLVLPEWRRVRLLPHASEVHRFTVDRHIVETCVEASRLIRRVARPDLLLVGALLHDIGKGGRVDHSVAGEPVAVQVATRLGLAPGDVAVVGTLVRQHLLLSGTATSRDLEDPATLDHVAERVRDVEVLDLLEVLTEADARATSTKAWSGWRSGLVAALAGRVRARLAGDGVRRDGAVPVGDEPDLPPEATTDPSYLGVEVARDEHGSCVRVVAHDRIGLMADVSGVLALMRLSVRSARAWTHDRVALSSWEVDDDLVDATVLRERLEAVVSGALDPSARVRPRPDLLEPSVLLRHEASSEATVMEVRTADRRGAVHLVCRALADLDVSVRSAHVCTFGPQSLDVFYLQEPGAGALSDERAATAAHAVRERLAPAATLEH